MAAGLNYEGNVILGDYPCDISSIVRYRGGFTLPDASLLVFEGYKFPIFTPLMLNLTKREFNIADSAFSMPADWDPTNDFLRYCFSYVAFTAVKGLSITAILHADEISFTGLNALRYYNTTSTDGKEFDSYKYLLEEAAQRTALITTFDNSKNTYIW